MASINKNPYFRAKRSLNGFDMSEWLQFSVGTGMLLPISYDLLQPGEKLEINSRTFIRTETLTSSAFVRLRYRIEFFFVPFPQLYSYFGSKFYGIHDYHSAALVNPRSVSFNDIRYPSFTSDQIDDFITANLDKIDGQGVPRVYGINRLLDAFGVTANVNKNRISNDTDVVPFYWFQAYQRIFDSFYRNDMYEPTDRKSYNADDLIDFQLDHALQHMEYDRFYNVFELRYRNYPRDYFTNVQQSPMFNSLSVDALYPTDSSSLFSSLQPYPLDDPRQGYYMMSGYSAKGSETSPLADGQKVSNPVQAYSVGENHSVTAASASQVSAASIRQMFAVEKLLSITQRTKKTYEAQTLAHFGYDVPENVGNKVYFIGSHDGIIQIQDVNATATTMGADSSRLGEVAGKGIGSSGKNKPLRFTAPWHGVYMAIFSIVPDVIYNNDEVGSRLTRISRFDEMYKPEFDKLGMSPRYRFEYNNGRIEQLDTAVVGYSYNYYWLKNKYDRAWGNFLTSNRNWTAKRIVPSDGNLSAPFFYYSPASLDDIMLTPFSKAVPTSLADVYDRCYYYDPFLCDVDLNVKKVSGMSTYGLPQL